MPKKKKEVKKELTHDKRYLLFGSIYAVCSVLWIIVGFIKLSNEIKMWYLDIICGVLLLILGVVYFIRYKVEK